MIHSGLRPFKCERCSMAFSTNSNLQRHMKIHLATKRKALNRAEAFMPKKQKITSESTNLKEINSFKRSLELHSSSCGDKNSSDKIVQNKISKDDFERKLRLVRKRPSAASPKPVGNVLEENKESPKNSRKKHSMTMQEVSNISNPIFNNIDFSAVPDIVFPASKARFPNISSPIRGPLTLADSEPSVSIIADNSDSSISYQGDDDYSQTNVVSKEKCIVDYSNLLPKKHCRRQISRYECTYCSYSSCRKSNYDRHMRKHTGERQFICNICKYAFNTKTDCCRHVQRKHSLPKEKAAEEIEYNPSMTTTTVAVNDVGLLDNIKRESSHNNNSCSENEAIDRYYSPETDDYFLNITDISIEKEPLDLTVAANDVGLLENVERETSHNFCSENEAIDSYFLSGTDDYFRNITDISGNEEPLDSTLKVIDRRFNTRNRAVKHPVKQNEVYPSNVLNTFLNKIYGTPRPAYSSPVTYPVTNVVNTQKWIVDCSNLLPKKHGRRQISRYECTYCSYNSYKKSNYDRHMRKHTGERPFICNICKYAFTTKVHCCRHVQRKHSLPKEKAAGEIEYNPSMTTPTAAVNDVGLLKNIKSESSHNNIFCSKNEAIDRCYSPETDDYFLNITDKYIKEEPLDLISYISIMYK